MPGPIRISIYKNKDRALAILRARLYQQAVQEREVAIAGQRRSQVGTGMRNERIRTYNFPRGGSPTTGSA